MDLNEQTLAALCHEYPEFSELFEEWRQVVAAFAHWRESNGAEAADRADEFAALLVELEAELQMAIRTVKWHGGSPGSVDGGKEQ